MNSNITVDDLQKRIDEVRWKIINEFVPKQPEKNNTSFPPEYGYIIDYYRNYYNIYISILPKSNTELSNSPDLIFDWSGNFYHLEKNKILYKYNFSDANYITVIRTILVEVANYLKTINN